MFTNKYPYTDFEKLNLDWFLKEFVKLKNDLTALQQTVASLDTVTANPTLSGTEPLLTGLEIGDDKYKVPDEVNANPTLSGTEPLLTGLQVGSDVYKAPDQVTLYGSNPPSSTYECGGIKVGNGQVYQVSYVQANPSGAITTPLNTIRIRNNLFRILPTVSPSDVGKFLRVNASGYWVAETVPAAEGEDF